MKNINFNEKNKYTRKVFKYYVLYIVDDV